MYRFVRDTIMAEAKISRACANFLSDARLYPWLAQGGGGINDAGTQQVRFSSNGASVSSRCDVWIDAPALISGSLTRRMGHPLAVLDLEYHSFRYREHLSGTSTLTLFDVTLPETICVGLPRDTYRLKQIIDFSRYKPWFFVRADPLARSIRSATRLQTIDYKMHARTKALIVTMVDEWSQKNWDYWSPEHGYVDRME